MNSHSFWGGIHMEIHKIIIPTPYAVGDVNAFLVKGDTLTLFDAGPKTQEAYDAIQWGIRAAGYTMSEVEQVILTHHHPDHAGWVDAFPRAEKLAHPYVDHWLRKEPAFLDYHRAFYRQELAFQGVPEELVEKVIHVRGEIELFGSTPLTGFINDGDAVPGHPNLKVMHVPGHAQSHLIFYDEKTGEGITGDMLLANSPSNPLVEPPVDLSMERPKSLVQYGNSLQKIQQLQPKKLYTGHGDEITDVAAVVKERFEKHQSRALKILELLDESKTVFELSKIIFPKIYLVYPGLTLSETLGKLDILESRGRVEKLLVDGVHYYKRV